MIVLRLQDWTSYYENEAFEDAQDEDYNYRQNASDNDGNDKLLERDWNEMAPDEIYEAVEFEQVNIQDDDPEPESDKDDKIETNAYEIQDEDNEPSID